MLVYQADLYTAAPGADQTEPNNGVKTWKFFTETPVIKAGTLSAGTAYLGTQAKRAWGDPFFFQGCGSAGYRRQECDEKAPWVAGISVVEESDASIVHGFFIIHHNMESTHAPTYIWVQKRPDVDPYYTGVMPPYQGHAMVVGRSDNDYPNLMYVPHHKGLYHAPHF